MNIYINSHGLLYLGGGVVIIGVIFDDDNMPELKKFLQGINQKNKIRVVEALQERYIAEYKFIKFGESELTFLKNLKRNIDLILYSLIDKANLQVSETKVYISKTLPKPNFNIRNIIIEKSTNPALSSSKVIARIKHKKEIEKINIIEPQYFFNIHQGSFSEKHISAIFKHGFSIYHREDITERIVRQLIKIWLRGESRYVNFLYYLTNPLPRWWIAREKVLFNRKVRTLKDYCDAEKRRTILKKITKKRYNPEILKFIKSNKPEGLIDEIFL